MSPPQPNHRQADDGKGGERADRGHVAKRVDIEEGCRHPRDQPDQQRVDPRRLELGVHRREDARQQAIAGHRVEDARLAIHQNQHHRGQADDCASLHQLREPRPLRAKRVDSDRDGIGHVERLVVDDQRHHDRDEDVDRGADEQRTEQADRHVLRRVLGFLACGRDCLETDIGKEHDRCRAKDAAPAELTLVAARWRNEGRPVGLERTEMRDHKGTANHDEGDDDGQLDRDDDVVDLRAFRHAHDQQCRHRHTDQESGEVEEIGDWRTVDEHGNEFPADGMLDDMAGRAGQLDWNDQAEIAKQADDIARPADRDDRCGKPIFEQQQRAHDPGRELTNRGVAIGIGRPGNGESRRQFGVAQPGERADKARDQKRDQHGRAGMERGGVAGAHEDASPDDAANAQENEVPGTKRAFELAGLCLSLYLLHGLSEQHTVQDTRSGLCRHSKSPPSSDRCRREKLDCGET